MTTFNLQLEDKIYKIDLYPEVRVAITRHMVQLYTEFCAVNPDKQITFDEYLTLVESQNHPANQTKNVLNNSGGNKTYNVNVTTGGGDPTAIALQIQREMARSAALAM